ncbi:MAG: hypothetical protein K6E32_02930 [Lachnospiraceae bacterium]|nr:hypothetical protein [Lachnospiraceae bacterium]
MSNNIYKGSFVRFTPENTKVIDTNDLVAKKLESYTNLLREREEADEYREREVDDASEEGDLSALTEDPDAGGEFAPEGEYAPESEEPAAPSYEDIKKACDDMINEANAQASSVLSEAENKAKSIRENAFEEGRKEGYDAGMAEAEENYQAKVGELEQKEAFMRSQYEDLVKELEPKMVDVITGVYEKIFGMGFYHKKDVLVTLISRALADAETDDKIIVHVSAEDYELVEEAKEELFADLPSSAAPEIRKRESMASGEAKVETAYGIMDCSVDTELKELSKTLKILAHGD